uniref:Uncharacterized protein n=1 Tax=Physcomitrium patens TaxID=3218 RepID=A0A7I4ECY1_PHYPA
MSCHAIRSCKIIHVFLQSVSVSGPTRISVLTTAMAEAHSQQSMASEVHPLAASGFNAD